MNLSDMNKEELIEYINIIEDDLNEKDKSIQKLEKDCKEIEKLYEEMINEKNQELVRLKGKVISQDITLRSYKDKVGIPLIIEGVEKDLYDGEQKDFILSLIEKAYDESDNYSRKNSICKSILNSNKENGKRKYIIEELSRIFKSYNGINSSLISELNKLGFEVVDNTGGQHYKFTYKNDSRYSISISRTPSDFKKCGLNALTDINKTLL